MGKYKHCHFRFVSFTDFKSILGITYNYTFTTQGKKAVLVLHLLSYSSLAFSLFYVHRGHTRCLPSTFHV